MTHSEIASAILNNLTSGEGIANTRIPLQQVRDEIDTLRARLLMERFQQGFPVEVENYQSLNCIQVECKDIADCCEVDSDEKVLVADLPTTPVVLNGKPLVNYAGIINRKRPFRIITGNHNVYAFSSKLIGHVPTLWFDNRRAILFNPPTTAIKYITISAVWTNPAKLAQYDCCSDYETQDYPAPAGLIDIMIGKITDSYIRYFYRMNPLQPNQQIDTQGLGTGRK